MNGEPQEKLPWLIPADRWGITWGGIKNTLAFVGAVFIVLTVLMLLGVDVPSALDCPEGTEQVDVGPYGGKVCE